jgi:hypothetical protein
MHMVEMIEARLKSEKVERDDLLSSLLDASDQLEGGGLTVDELIGTFFWDHLFRVGRLKATSQATFLYSCWLAMR